MGAENGFAAVCLLVVDRQRVLGRPKAEDISLNVPESRFFLMEH